MSDYTTEAYNRKASTYEERWKSYLRHTHKEFLKHIETGSRDAILDLSCGTGLLAKAMIDRGLQFDRLILNDPSEQMLAIARERLSTSPNVSFTNFSAEQLKFEEKQFDRILCLNAFHFYECQQQVLEQIHALLKPEGRFYLLDWNRTGLFIIVNKIIRWTTSERINTRSLAEIEEMLQKRRLEIKVSDEWNWRYWKFLFVEAEKEN